MILYVASALTFIFLGFAVTSRGSLFTEKVKSYSSVIAFTIQLSAIIYSILTRFWWGILIEIVLLVFCPGIGYTIYCLLKRKE